MLLAHNCSQYLNSGSISSPELLNICIWIMLIKQSSPLQSHKLLDACLQSRFREFSASIPCIQINQFQKSVDFRITSFCICSQSRHFLYIIFVLSFEGFFMIFFSFFQFCDFYLFPYKNFY